MTNERSSELFDRQVSRLTAAGYPQFLGLSLERFNAAAEKLREHVRKMPEATIAGNIPLCLAFRPSALNIADAMATVTAKSSAGIVDMNPFVPNDFDTIDGVCIPEGDLYLLVDVDTGRDFLNISPETALVTLTARGRSPLTLHEGVALTLQFPEILTDKDRFNCIQMAGSRKPADQRVPSIWVSKGRPRLGWCWDRNIHTWLGTASVAYRIGSA